MYRPELLEYDLGARVRAFSTFRWEGYSTGAYASFNANTYCGDDAEHVARNRVLLCAALGIGEERLLIPHQVHLSRVLAIEDSTLAADEAVRREMLEGVDAVMTDLSQVCVSVSTADCIPVLLYDETHHAVAAVHAGWRGTVMRIVEVTVEAMSRRYGTVPAELRAVIGPGISLETFEVGDEVYEAFRSADFPMDGIARRFPSKTPSQAEPQTKWHIDLWEANRLSLWRAGVQPDRIHIAGVCTYSNPERFFSARRLGIRSGRILNGILLTD